MKHILTPVLSFLVCLTFFSSCKKGNTDPLSQLPEASHTGANTLGFLADGKPFYVSGKSSFSNPDGTDFIPISSSAWLVKGNASPQAIRISFTGNLRSEKIGIYPLKDNYPSGGLYSNPQNGTAILGNTEFKTNAKDFGEIIVTYYDSSVIAGNFHFDAANDSGEVVHITDGRFDIHR